MRDLLLDAKARVGEQMVGKRRVKHSDVLVGRARGATDDKTAKLDKHVPDSSRLIGAIQAPARVAQ
jgi:hypothetical protein